MKSFLKKNKQQKMMRRKRKSSELRISSIIFKSGKKLVFMEEEEEESFIMHDIDYTDGLLSTSKTSLIIKGEEVVDNGEFEVLKNVITPINFQDACYSMGLLCDDRKFITTISEVTEFVFSHQLRKLFVILLISNSVGKSYHIERILNSNTRSLRDYQLMPYLELSDIRLFQNKLIEEELAYDTNEFLLPITITDESTCHIKHGSLKAELLIQSSLII
ncbi:hypothetical protein Ahy_A06g028318 [Arachis hypogaea]|uniref:Uncharacterized protein n=1 Tax=Arachis hypogaea TaxID=3818 RepID=A0A445CQR9_ARAHY|nr:hypothetical protein Ahy_A06g028318 [Arachis hypogaea]